jgi:hypothetical protein
MTAIVSLKCSGCGKIHRVISETQPETPEQHAQEAVLAGWGYSMDQDRLILICSYPCGQGVMTKKGTPRKRVRRTSGTAGAFA